MLHATVNDKKTKPETSRSEVEQEPQRLKSFSGWGDRTTQGQNSRLAAMQQAYGNQAALRMMNGGVLQRKCACGNTAGLSGTCAECQSKREGMLQTKLRISEPGDRYEQEADRIADQVMRMPESTIQRQVESEKEGIVQRKAIANSITPLQPSSTDEDQPSEILPIVNEVLESQGQPLDSVTQLSMESLYGRNFSQVRVHIGSKAAESARAINALAYTVGQNVVFDSGQYSLGTRTGQRLLAHELVHTIQQNNVSERENLPHLQRSSKKNKSSAADGYIIHPALLNDAVSILEQLYARLDASTLKELREHKTIVIGVVVEQDDPNIARFVWTANGNWNNPKVAAILDSLNVTRWDSGVSRSDRGSVGAPGDAEQRILDYAEDSDFVVKAMAVSRIVCPDCNEAIHDYEQQYGSILIKAVPLPATTRSSSADEALLKLDDYRQRLQNQLDMSFGSHKAQSNLINQPSVIGFVGFWTNRLFNSDVPPLLIWNNAYAALTAAQSAIKRKDVAGTLKNLIRARRAYLIAYRRYIAWKNGIESAGSKAQVAIGVVAVATVVAFVAPSVVAALSESSVGGAAAAEQTVARISATIAQADSTMLAADVLMSEMEIMAEAELEAEMLLFL